MSLAKITVAIAFMLIASVVQGQNERSDSIRLSVTQTDSIKAAGSENAIWEYESLAYFQRLTAEQYLARQMRDGIDFGSLYVAITPGEVVPAVWRNGGVTVKGGRQSLPGMMGIESGEAGVYQGVGRLNVYAGVMASKYGYFQGLHTQYGLTGNVSYKISPELTLTAFGTYYFNGVPTLGPGLPLPPSMAGYYGRTKYGVTLDYSINERWGVETGVQMVQPIGTRRFEAEPIVTPYYKIGNGKRKVIIELPVGEMLYHIVRRHAH